MAALLTTTTLPCNVISSNRLYHNLANTTFLNNNDTSNSFTEKSNLNKIYKSKLRTSSIDSNDKRKLKDSNKKFVSSKSLSHARNRTSSIKQIEKKTIEILETTDKTMSNSDIKENNSQGKSKKVENKKINKAKKNVNININENNNVNSKIKTKTKITTTKVINIQNIGTQSQNPRMQTGNVSRKAINIRNTKKSSPRTAMAKLKLPNKDSSNTLSLSKLSINNSYANSKRGCNAYSDQYFTNYNYNPEFSKKYRIKEEMGRGGFGLVFVAERISDGKEVAVKFIIKEKVPVSAWVKDPELGIVPREVFLLKNVDHPCIIKYLDCYSDRKYFYLVTELHGSPWCEKNNSRSYQNENDTVNTKYCSLINAAALKTNNKFQVGQVRPSMDLFECIESYFECFYENQARYIFIQLLSAIKYLDSLNIIHRDIKDENILIDKNLNIKLIDFGAAIQVKGGRVYDRFVGTIPYIAPEVLNGQEYSALTQDIYSLGVLLHLLIYGELPAVSLMKEDNTPLNLPHCTIKGNYCSEEVRHLIRWMLQKSPSSRPSLNEILSHDWVKGKTNLSK